MLISKTTEIFPKNFQKTTLSAKSKNASSAVRSRYKLPKFQPFITVERYAKISTEYMLKF